ncbi:hypothetical protein Btru_009099 [Bulinus truncatus]|nr:hypothetical protein Btru_009099 [Bulinus truncatus]
MEISLWVYHTGYRTAGILFSLVKRSSTRMAQFAVFLAVSLLATVSSLYIDNNTYVDPANQYQVPTQDSSNGVYPCNKDLEGKTYPIAGRCRYYYRCENGESLFKECQQYNRFDATTYTCVPDKSCYNDVLQPPKVDYPTPAPYVPKTEYPTPAPYVPKTEYPTPAPYVPKTEYPTPAPYVPKTEYPTPAPYVPKTEYPTPAPYVPKTVYPTPAPYVPKTVYPTPAPYVPKTVYPTPAPYVPKTVYPTPAPYVAYNVYSNQLDNGQGVYPCNKQLEGKTYAIAGFCLGYFVCQDGEISYRECQEYNRFDAQSYKCVPDKTCYIVAKPPVVPVYGPVSNYQETLAYDPIVDYQGIPVYVPNNVYPIQPVYTPNIIYPVQPVYTPNNVYPDPPVYVPTNDNSGNSGNYPCNKQLEGKTYAIDGFCLGYFVCQDGESLYKECPDYNRFDAKTYKCVPDNTCKKDALPTPNYVQPTYAPKIYNPTPAPYVPKTEYPTPAPYVPKVYYPTPAPYVPKTEYPTPAPYPAVSDNSQVDYPCNKQLEGKTYAIVDFCIGYFQCINGESLYKECPDYNRFDAKTYKCVPDNTCKKDALPTPNDYQPQPSYVQPTYAPKIYNPTPAPYVPKTEYPTPAPYVPKTVYPTPAPYVPKVNYPTPAPYVPKTEYPTPAPYAPNNDNSQDGYPCNKQLEGKTYAIVDFCIGYFQCINGESLYKECPDYNRFDAKTYKCVPDNTCKKGNGY